ncbi:phosphatidate cytidylyltransferase [Thorsellia anophelis]|uniref:Phosphatidate cytidylyltransferase n=1 Tax=Thorsellia anophelis DSM 18579 TaxID=1123402 RepID=A0A1H9YQT6_9GAMM|nr:phosphatidate cytidylyltransferase [Thorsellia anophelis]SES71475.1 phosphatidate cytidylyltransferase [Thorsellia anophelis DSM 18579]
MFKQRVITSLILIPLAIGGLFYLDSFWFTAVLAVVGGLTAWEWTNMMHIKSSAMRMLLGAIFTCVVIACAAIFTPIQTAMVNHLILSISIGWWVAVIGLVLTYPKSSMIWKQTHFLKSLFILFILLPFIVGMVELKAMSPWWVMYVLCLVWISDTGAYLVGKKWGKHKLAPKVSPGKTWQGFGGALFFSCLLPVGVLLFKPEFIPVTTLQFFIISVITVIVSVFGDLAESMFKREAGVKDSSQLIPGHGGVFDRIDSLTAAVPIFFMLLQFAINGFNA